MKLTSVEIHDYKSIRNSREFSVGDITCLVGKNESGKTSVLQALYKLNPVVPEHGNYDVTDEYPRADVEDYQQQVELEQRTPTVVVSASYTLDASEVQRIEKVFGKAVLTSPVVRFSKDYNNKSYATVKADEAVAAAYLVSKAALPTEVSAKIKDCKTLDQCLELLQTDGEQRDAKSAALTAEAELIVDPDEKIKAIHEADTIAESAAAKKLKERLTLIEGRGLSLHIWDNYVWPTVPKFLYFDEYYQMEGHVNIEALKERQANNKLKESDRPMLGLIELARLNVEQLLNSTRTEQLISKLEGASNHLSKRILDYWSQNRHLHVRFDVRPGRLGDPEGMRSGTNLWGRVYDSVHEVSTQLGSRSRGFLWFFSFLAWFSQQSKGRERLILLLDEPGLFLHARAQGDLLAYMEAELMPHHQVLYTTHSPFMVDSRHFERIRIVEDKSVDHEGEQLSLDDRGTKVYSEVLEVGEDSLFPLQGALGYDIAQTLFVGPNCLIVEGVSDLLYLQTLSGLLQALGRAGLDSRWTITPVGGSEKVPTFAALLGSQKALKVATLIDIQAKDQTSIDNLYKRKLLEKSNVLTFAEFTGAKEADIEDMFEVRFYLKLVNTEFQKDLQAPIDEADVAEGPPRLLQRLERLFSSKPLTPPARFSHYRPARRLSQDVATLGPEISAATLDRFQLAFDRLNALV